MKLHPQKNHLPILLATLLCGCAAGPDYQRPAAPAASHYKQAFDLPAWKTATPDAPALAQEWWQLYGDDKLNELLAQVAAANQNIAQGAARYRQAAALADGAGASRWPSLDLNGSARRGTGTNGIAAGNNSNTYRLAADASWEADLWGRLRRQQEGSIATAQASAADLAATTLAVQSGFAQTYFQLRIADAQQRLLDDAVQAYRRSLELTQNRYKVGVSARSDVSQAQTQLQSTLAQAADNRAQRAQLEHALAVLLGKAPAEFTLTADTAASGSYHVQRTLPAIPPGIPSSLLERRPDVAAAERRVAAANAGIGVAQAAIFPDLTLSASSGFQSSRWSKWLTLPNRVWSVGPALAASLFDAGLRRSQGDAAIAAYDATVATYRQTVLTSLQEVEDQLANLKWLEQEAEYLDAALESARLAERDALNRYQAGTVDFLSVVTLQTTALGIERNALGVFGRRLNASIGLVKALGGGWTPPAAAPGTTSSDPAQPAAHAPTEPKAAEKK
ncbi:efflux transporter outer membrane subunit [Janthinobacterium sp. 17J80-10]|uniref:efflux transporter outer membrane subunit n=1 Tax=Janthinobacterium sp. 17J80-10 TaxID=2497863 RepID=UPI0010052D52|nr:efflux transporter outer membrane subunit [Janthinobacterium sp. 17J80-10]QAU33942.1 efflux transporter outer membrane subunit [Janthinobacterium sp. 17J80-10]